MEHMPSLHDFSEFLIAVGMLLAWWQGYRNGKKADIIGKKVDIIHATTNGMTEKLKDANSQLVEEVRTGATAIGKAEGRQAEKDEIKASKNE